MTIKTKLEFALKELAPDSVRHALAIEAIQAAKKDAERLQFDLATARAKAWITLSEITRGPLNSWDFKTLEGDA